MTLRFSLRGSCCPRKHLVAFLLCCPYPLADIVRQRQLRLSGHVALWHYDTKALWHCGTLTLWHVTHKLIDSERDNPTWRRRRWRPQSWWQIHASCWALLGMGRGVYGVMAGVGVEGWARQGAPRGVKQWLVG